MGGVGPAPFALTFCSSFVAEVQIHVHAETVKLVGQGLGLHGEGAHQVTMVVGSEEIGQAQLQRLENVYKEELWLYRVSPPQEKGKTQSTLQTRYFFLCSHYLHRSLFTHFP